MMQMISLGKVVRFPPLGGVTLERRGLAMVTCACHLGLIRAEKPGALFGEKTASGPASPNPPVKNGGEGFKRKIEVGASFKSGQSGGWRLDLFAVSMLG